ncbi:MAG: hypothetical protein GXP25_09715 [Planctomycetes bacterium]|nr:hypothetical protein [Planctomycetota bacterium]
MEGPLQKPDRDPDVTERMIMKSRQVHQKEQTRRWIGFIVIVLLIVIAACAAHYYLRGGGAISVTK